MKENASCEFILHPSSFILHPFMSDSLPKLEEHYTHALQDYLGGAGEAALKRAYELGRQAIDSRLGVLDMSAIHQAALAEVLSGITTLSESVQTAEQAQIFLTESLSAFEMAQRGFQEAILKLHSLNETLEQQVAERTRELRETNQTLQALIQASPLAIVVLDPQKQVKLWNPAAEHLYGWAATEVLDRPHPIISADRQAEFQALHATVLNGISVTGVEVERLRKDGRKIFISLSAATLVDPQGQASGAIFIGEDITERRRAERAQRLLAEAGHLLAASLDDLATLNGLANLLVPNLADWCSIELIEAGTLRRRIVAHTDPAKVEWLQTLLQRYPLDSQSAQGAPNVVRTGVSEIYPEISNAALAVTDTNDADSPESHISRELGITSALIVPMTARGRTFGAITLVWAESGQHYTSADLALAEELARRASLVVDNARLYAEAQRLNAELEQRVLERTTELQIANLELAAEVAERKEAQAEIQRQAARAQALVQSAARLNAQLNLDAVIQAVCEETVLALNVPLATVSLYAPERQVLYYAGGVGLPFEYEQNLQPMPLSAYEAYTQHRPLLITPDVQLLPDLSNAEVYTQLNVRTTVNVSLVRDGQLIGRLNIGTVGEAREFTEEELTVLRGLAAQAAQAIINARLFEAVQKELTERKRAEEKIRASESSLAQAQQIAHLGNWSWDISTNRLTWSDELYRIYGLDPQEFSATYEAFLERIQPDDRDRVRQVMDQASQDYRPFTFEHRIVRPDGTVRTLLAQGHVILDAARRPIRMIGTGQDITERKRIETELKNSREQLRALSAHLQSVREQERTSIAREIHDELGQALTGLKMDLSWLQKNLGQERKVLSKKLRTMSKLMDETVQTGRRISAELRPGALDDLGLAAAIEWQLQEFQTRTGIRCKLNSEVGEELDLGPDGSTAMFRIFQETLTNVARHAHASRVAVTLTQPEGSLLLRVRDNGRGITSTEIAHPQSFGLIGMQERIHLLAGEISIEGAPGKGTMVTVKVPLSQPTGLGVSPVENATAESAVTPAPQPDHVNLGETQ